MHFHLPRRYLSEKKRYLISHLEFVDKTYLNNLSGLLSCFLKKRDIKKTERVYTKLKSPLLLQCWDGSGVLFKPPKALQHRVLWFAVALAGHQCDGVVLSMWLGSQMA